MKENTQWRLRDSEGKEYIIINSKKVDLQEELNKTIVKQQEKIEKLQTIINELEKILLEWHQYWEDEDTYNFEYKNVYDYVQELKGDSSNE